MMHRPVVLIFLLLVVGGLTATAQDPEPIPPVPSNDSDTTSADDSSAVVDSTRTDSTAVDSAAADSVVDPAQLLKSFEDRWQEFKKDQPQEAPFVFFSFHDTVATYFTSPRIDSRRDIVASWANDAGDYFRTNPSFFVSRWQSSPMRTTVQPYGVAGDRLGIVVDRFRYRPFEHTVEPDGLIDLNDIPIANDQHMYVIPGALGQLFGSRHGLATLLTRPKQPEGTEHESRFEAEEGGYGYSYIRGRLTKDSRNGRHANASIEYREALGPTTGRDDDLYALYGDFFFPQSRTWGIRASGILYDRDGALSVWPDRGGATLRRFRKEENLWVSLNRHNADLSARYELGLLRITHENRYRGAYDAAYKLYEQALFARRDWATAGGVWTAGVELHQAEYDNQYQLFRQKRLSTDTRTARYGGDWKYAATAGADWVEKFGILPRAGLTLMRETPRSFVLFTVGWDSRAPTLEEMYQRFRRFTIYSGTSNNYGERGFEDLKPEKQLTAHLSAEIGSVDNNLGLHLTGGRIVDGIDWVPIPTIDQITGVEPNVDTTFYTLFTPRNGDVTFFDASITNRLLIPDVWFLDIYLNNGASWRTIDYDLFDQRPYQPDVELFSGMELHVFWPHLLVDLFAYGEIRYTSEYVGYDQQIGLGKEAIANIKLSIGLKDFRWFFVFQNALSNPQRVREYQIQPGRFTYYGLTWSFQG